MRMMTIAKKLHIVYVLTLMCCLLSTVLLFCCQEATLIIHVDFGGLRECSSWVAGTIDVITVLEAILMSRQTRLEITVLVWKSDVK